MSDEASTPPDSTSSPQAVNTQAPLSEPVSAPVIEPTPPPEAAAPAPEPEITQTETPAPEQVSENLTGKQAEVSEAVPGPTPEPPQQATQADTTPPSQENTTPPQSSSQLRGGGERAIIGELLLKARAKIQDRRRKKLERIMTKLSETGKISNSEVQKLLRVSDATATRYLDILEKESKIRQEGKTGKYVVYVRV